MFDKIREGVNSLEERMCEYSEMNSVMFTHNKIYLLAGKGMCNNPEYSHQPYSFKYGDYSLSEYLKQYI